jgi:hypothetical protein
MTAQDSTYDARALRTSGILGVVEVYRGSENDLVGRVGTLRGLDLASVVSASPNAVLEARKFQRDYRIAALEVSAAIVSLGLASGLHKVTDLSSLVHEATWGGTFVLFVLGARSFMTAYSALSKSIWWYNRDIAVTR